MILEIEVKYGAQIERDYYNENHPTDTTYNHSVFFSGGVWVVADSGGGWVATNDGKFGVYTTEPYWDQNYVYTVRIACFGDSKPSSGKIPRPSTPMSVEKELKLAQIARSVDATRFGRSSWRTLLTAIASGQVRCVKVDRK